MSSYGIRPHALTIDLPAPEPEGLGPLTPEVERLVINRAGSLFWNSAPVSDAELVSILANMSRGTRQPTLLFSPDADAPYGRVVEVLGLLRKQGVLDRCFRLSGISRYRAYDRPETFDDPAPYVREDCMPVLGY